MQNHWAQLFCRVAITVMVMSSMGCKLPPPTSPGAIARESNVLLWGDTHVHAGKESGGDEAGLRSVDVDTAYRFARGLPVVSPFTRARIQLQRPLDFVVVADPAEELEKARWDRLIEAAERYDSPCVFTTFIGWQWSSELEGHVLHRVVLMDAGGGVARELVPFSALDGSRPEDLWSWLAETSGRLNTDFISIPHGSNRSGGKMYPDVGSDGAPITAIGARTRMRWEPVSEVTQIRGDAETHPTLSPDDAFADFERLRSATGEETGTSDMAGDYLRSALLRGLRIDRSVGVNPYEIGLIGSTGTHTGLASADEHHFWGASPTGADSSAQGLAAVWAEENTRVSIFDAFKRKEVYATTGPRIRVRFFGGWQFNAKQAAKPNMVTVGYTLGRPMGSELPPRPEARKPKVPGFLMYAVRDPEGAKLDRIQLVKGWVDDRGSTHEKVFDVVWSAGRGREPDGTLSPVHDLVDPRTGKVSDAEGADSFHAFWSDPDFDPDQPAFYYLRVLQVPTPRHTLYDAIASGKDPKDTDHPPTIQERAYTSPIWYRGHAPPLKP